MLRESARGNSNAVIPKPMCQAGVPGSRLPVSCGSMASRISVNGGCTAVCARIWARILLHLHSAMRCAMKGIPIWHRMSFSSAEMKNRMMRFWVQQSSTTMLWKSTTVSSLPFSTKRSMAMSFYSRLMPKLPRRISGRKLIEGNCKKLQQLPIFL